jgi:Fe-S-cluster-containing dehydrogenase component
MGINRRGFLKIISAAGAGHLLGSSEKALAQEYFPGWPDRLGMLTDLTLCIGRNCRKCEAACNEANKLPPPKVPLEDNSVFETKRRPDAQNYTVVNRFPNPKPGGQPVYVKKQCMHCNEPACASACLVGALKKTPEGPVIYDKDVCIGCRYCMTACPFYVPAYDYFDPLTPQVRKCTMCYTTKILKGEVPACAKICPKEAITFAKRSELIKLAREKIRTNPDRYIDHVYGEHEAGGTSWLYISGVPFEQLDFSVDLGVTPFPEFTRGFLSLVPAVLMIWPALLGGLYTFTKYRNRIGQGEDTRPEKKEGQP